MARWPRSAQQVTQIAWLFALALFMTLTTTIATAQENIEIVGSGIALPLLEDLATAAEQEVAVNVTGTGPGLQALCNGEASLVAVPRAINSDEDAACTENGVTYSELLIANDILAVVTNADSNLPTCLTTDVINTLLAPSAANRVSDWTGFVEQAADEAEAPEAPALSVYLPEAGTRTYALLDSLISGAGLRADATLADTATILSSVAETEGALGVVSLPDALAAGDSVSVLNINTASTGAGCVAPASETLEADTYTYGQPILLYVADSAREDLSDFLSLITSQDLANTLTEDGFVAVSESAQAINQAVIAGESEDGRQFTTAQTNFQVPASLTGEVVVSGTGAGYSYVNSALSTLTSAQTGLNVRYQIEGNAAGIRRLCNGEADIVITTTTLSDEQNAACEANEIVPVTMPLGTQATVLVAHAADEFAACLTTDQINTLWGATGEELPTNWNQVDASFPDQGVTLFAPSLGSIYGDIMMQYSAPLLPVRDDTETSADALYRAAATANVEGALTFMSWPDYVRVLDNEQANIQLVGVDAGNGCITPSEETITAGEYPLTLTTHLVTSQSALIDVNVQSILWTLFEDSNLSTLQTNGYVGLSGNVLPGLRQQLEREFSAASEAALASAPATNTDAETDTDADATDEAAEDTTDTTEEEVTEEAEATEEATEAPTEDATEEMTEEATEEAEATEAATEEATEEAVEDVEATATSES